MMKSSQQGRKATSKQADGKQAEEIAKQHLLNNGLKLIEQNYHSRYGEIDLVMQHEDNIVFVEVRYRKHSGYGSAAESVNYSKQQKIRITASQYLQQHSPKANARFDVVAISSLSDKNAIDWIQHAFE